MAGQYFIPNGSDSYNASADSNERPLSSRRFLARLALNENPFGPSHRALAAVQDEFAEFCRYVDEDEDKLTPAIVAHERVSGDQILLGEILPELGVYLASVGPIGGEFIYSEPGYKAFVDAVRPGGGVVIGVPLNEDFQNDLAAIAATVNTRTQAIFVVNPHNPTGTVSDAAVFLDFVREMSKRTMVIVDEAYLEYQTDFDQRTAVGLTRAGENVIVFRTFGKIYGLAGLSIGYAIAPEPVTAALKRAGIGLSAALSRPALAAAAASVGDEEYVAGVRAKVSEERSKWNELFAALNLRHTDARANFVCFETPLPHHEVAKTLLRMGIRIGGEILPLERWVRISIGTPEENAMARDAIASLLK